ncbi:MAG TPA: hypothetical protein EYP85_09865 [Armatimonadetes bacterium]|nr:hypothetical protein [Armatimonadota bacterium]
MNTLELTIRRKVDECGDWLAQKAQSLVNQTEIYRNNSGMKDDQLHKIALLASWTQSVRKVVARLEHQTGKDLGDIGNNKRGKRWAWGARRQNNNLRDQEQAFGNQLKVVLTEELYQQANQLASDISEAERDENLVKQIHIRLVRSFLQLLIWTFGYQNVTQGG